MGTHAAQNSRPFCLGSNPSLEEITLSGHCQSDEFGKNMAKRTSVECKIFRRNIFGTLLLMEEIPHHLESVWMFPKIVVPPNHPF